MELNVIERSHSVWIDCTDSIVRKYVYNYLPKIISMKEENVRGRKRMVRDKVYAVRSPCEKYIGMLKTTFKDFLNEVSFTDGYHPTIKVKKELPKSFDKSGLKLKEGVTFKDEEQEQAYKHLQKPLPLHVLECATGFGKTFLGLYSSTLKDKKTIFLMGAGHIVTWLADIEKFVDCKKTDIGIIQGMDTLIGAYQLRKEDKYTPKFIFVSAETFREYIKAYEAGESKIDLAPHEFCEFFGVGRVVRDEVHEQLYNLVRQTIYLNVEELLCLSATIVNGSRFIENMYKHVFPLECRWKSKNNTHIEAYSVRYSSDPCLKIKSGNGFGYSQTRYEKFILKRPFLRKQYADMLKDMVVRFQDDYEPGMRMIVFCGLTEMCEYMTEQLKPMFPDLKVNTYIAKTKASVLKESDVIVTTMGSCGTGKDLPDLAHSYNMHAVGSKIKAWQTMGRLRPLKNYPDKNTKYYFFSNMAIPAHRKYEQLRRIDLVDKTKFIRTINLGCTLRKFR